MIGIERNRLSTILGTVSINLVVHFKFRSDKLPGILRMFFVQIK